MLRLAIETLPEQPGPYAMSSAIYKANPTLAGAQQGAVEFEQSWKPRFNTKEGLSAVLRKTPRDFHMPAWQRFRGWACEPDFRGSVW